MDVHGEPHGLARGKEARAPKWKPADARIRAPSERAIMHLRARTRVPRLKFRNRRADFTPTLAEIARPPALSRWSKDLERLLGVFGLMFFFRNCWIGFICSFYSKRLYSKLC